MCVCVCVCVCVSEHICQSISLCVCVYVSLSKIVCMCFYCDGWYPSFITSTIVTFNHNMVQYCHKCFSVGAPFISVGRALSHIQRLCPRFESRPGALCWMSLPFSLILFPVKSLSVLSIKPYKGQNKNTCFSVSS